MDRLLAAVLDSTKPLADRRLEDLTEEVRAVDQQSDQLFQLSHLCISCTMEPALAHKLRVTIYLSWLI